MYAVMTPRQFDGTHNKKEKKKRNVGFNISAISYIRVPVLKMNKMSINSMEETGTSNNDIETKTIKNQREDHP